MNSLSLQQTNQMFQKVADQIIANQAVLTEADRAIGDGDHGVGMARGFTAVKKELANSTARDLGGLLRSIGTKLRRIEQTCEMGTAQPRQGHKTLAHGASRGYRDTPVAPSPDSRPTARAVGWALPPPPGLCRPSSGEPDARRK